MESDRFGLRTRYYQNGTYVKGYTEHLKTKGFQDYSPEGLSSYFSFRYPILSHTMFSDYTKEATQWRPVFSTHETSFEDAVNHIESLLIEAIAKNIGSYKRVGVMLSGGLDSSLIAAMVKCHFPDRELFTYSVGFSELNEFAYSQMVADKFSDKHKALAINAGEMVGEESLLVSLIGYKGAPVHPNEVALAYGERQAFQDGCGIVLCGEGADDIFGGYGQLLRMDINYKGDARGFPSFFMDEYRYFTQKETQSLLREEFFVPDTELVIKVFNEEECPQELNQKVLYFIQRIHTRGLIERGMNALSFNGLEPGFPFIDDKLIDYVNDLPFDYKVRWNSANDMEESRGYHYRDISEKHDTPKYILKQLAERYLVKEVIYRKKVGFPVPYDAWIEDMDIAELNPHVFKKVDVSRFNGWKKFMIYNLNTFVNVFEPYRRSRL